MYQPVLKPGNKIFPRASTYSVIFPWATRSLYFIRATWRGADVQPLFMASKELSQPKKPLLSASPAKELMAKNNF